MNTKRCTKCGEEKQLDYFSPRKQGKFGVNSRCKKCMAEKSAERRAANIERFRELERASYHRRREVVLAKKKELRLGSTGDKIREDARRRKAARREQYNEKQRAAYAANREKYIGYAIRYAKANKVVVAAKNNAWKRKAVERMHGKYLATLLGIPFSKCPTPLLEAKREQLQQYRLINQLKQTINERTES